LSAIFLPTLESGINVGVRILIFELFSRDYVFIKGGYVYYLFSFEIDLKNLWLLIHNITEFCIITIGGYIYSRVQKSIENWSVWSKMALGEVGVSLP